MTIPLVLLVIDFLANGFSEKGPCQVHWMGRLVRSEVSFIKKAHSSEMDLPGSTKMGEEALHLMEKGKVVHMTLVC